MRTDSMTKKEVEGVLALLTTGNRLVMRTALHTGLRVGDVLALRTEQLRPRFWITEQKTGKRRQVGLPGPLLADIRAEAGEKWAFPGRNPEKPRTRQAVWKDLKRAAWALRLPINVGTHSARKTYAVELLRRSGSVEQVQRALNHDRLETALIYALADHRRKKRAPPERLGLTNPARAWYKGGGGENGGRAERNKSSILWAPVPERSAERHRPGIKSRSAERHKIKILLRSEWICATIYLPKPFLRDIFRNGVPI